MFHLVGSVREFEDCRNLLLYLGGTTLTTRSSPELPTRLITVNYGKRKDRRVVSKSFPSYSVLVLVITYKPVFLVGRSKGQPRS